MNLQPSKSFHNSDSKNHSPSIGIATDRKGLLIPFTKILAIILFWELLIMIVLELVHLNQILEVLIDACSLTVLAGLSIWYFVFVPATKKIVEKQKHSEDLYNQLIQGMGRIAMIAIVDQNRNIVYANSLFLNNTGYSKDETIGKTIKMIRSSHHSAEFYDKIWKTVNEGKTWAGEMRNRRKDGEPIWTNTFIMSLHNTENHVIVFQFDVTEQKLLQEAVTQEQLKNIHVDRLALLGEMAGGVSHEINNPLTVITGLVTLTDQFLKSGDFADKERIEKEIARIDKIQFHTLRIKKIVNALKEFSRNGDSGTVTQPTNLQHIIEVIHDLNQEKLKDKGIAFSTDISDISFECNVAQIEEVLATLVNNAVDAIESLDSKWIKIESFKNGDFLEISVTDSGAGIPESIAAKIMNPFFTTKDIGKGTGLGLSIAKLLIEDHGGKLFIDTNSTNTKFVVRLPLNENPLLDLLDAKQAIEAHLAWRQKLIAMINNNSELPNVETIRADDKCELGRWIKKVHSTFDGNRTFMEMREAHSELHKCVANVILQIKSGNALASDLLIGSGSEFDELSNKVVSCLKRLKNSEVSQDYFSETEFCKTPA